MLTKKIFFTAVAALAATPAFAMLCPNNFNEITVGQTMEQIKQQCGPPDSEKSSDSKSDLPQEWNYYVQVSPTDQATLKTTIAFNKGKVTNMSVNGIGVSTTAICGGNNISVGDTEDSIKTACGKPAFINQGNVNGGTPTKVTDLTYGGTQAVVLEFEDGVFTGKK
jgi:hypothetical protein